MGVLEQLRNLVISYAGLILQEPEIFPQPSGYDSHRLSSMTRIVIPLLGNLSVHPNS